MSSSVRVSASIAKAILAAAKRGFPDGQKWGKGVVASTIDSALVSRSKFDGVDYQSNVAFQLARTLRRPPHQIASVLAEQMMVATTTTARQNAGAIAQQQKEGNKPTSENLTDDAGAGIVNVEVSGNGFLNVVLRDDWLLECSRTLAANIEASNRTRLDGSPTTTSKNNNASPTTTLVGDTCGDSGRGAATNDVAGIQQQQHRQPQPQRRQRRRTKQKQQRILVDFASPNMCKALHVGHLRSAIIGDSICRVLEFLGHDVDRVSHVGDWGTPMAMVLTELLNRPDRCVCACVRACVRASRSFVRSLIDYSIPYVWANTNMFCGFESVPTC